MNFFESLFLGIIQGISEFFPISSSAHLKLAKLFFKSDALNDLYLFDLVCHLGTLIASIIFLRKEIFKILKDKKKASLFIFAILPLFPFYFLLKPVREFFSETYFLPFFLLITSIFLFVASKLKIKEIEPLTHRRKIKDVLLIGIMQALALIPGISRSAFTITSAYFRGWKLSEAIRFSFLLAIPTILGGSFLESLKHFLKKETTYNLAISSYIIGFLASFLVGIFAIRYIFSIDTNKKLRPFAIYLFCLAIFSFIFLNAIN
ncbi:MAG: Undecaprenyl-diphosphatase [Candidatus Anoxychlamydiales bacterium]|nr:Undecaprenyl-diphosphatase [Candidatus Anoxychlamydiales bacterium]